ncbi:MAG: replication initiator protein A [Clostridia bacterium]|nr:replication initiator protein A [Clostridia bacterium]MBR6823161.1 replication initiator protein A [Clostridia bacterium]
MLDRMGLSTNNNWHDDLGRVFIYYTIEEIINKMGCCKQKAVKLLKELKEIGLIECERIGLTKPNRIYVKTF